MIAHLDCSSGISGDKFLGALLDAGFAENDLRAAVVRFGIPESALRVERIRSHGMAAVSLRLETDPDASPEPARHLADVRALIEAAGLPTRVTERAIGVFELLANAEARVHGTTTGDVHFHEVGALDAILDIVGVTLGLELLDIDSLTATPPALGSGTVGTSHGTLPVPAPATVELLLGVPTMPGPSGPGGQPAGELTTPTGAALLRAFTTDFGPMPTMIPESVGYGGGTRDIGSPNIARIVVGRAMDPADPPSDVDTSQALEVEAVTLLESNIDHLTPEQLAFCAEELFTDGALDVWQTPIVMKKGRAAVALSLMCTPTEADRLATRMHALTGTLGVRRSDQLRTVAAREQRTIDTRHGPVRVKIADVGGLKQARPEHDDVAGIARALGRPIAEITGEIAADLATCLLGF